MVAGAVQQLADVMWDSTQAAMQFEYQMIKIGNVGGDVVAAELDVLSGTIRDLAINSMFSLDEMGRAFYELSAAGSYSREELELIMTSVTNLATATGTDLVQATTTAAKIMNAYQMSAADAASLTDVLTQAANESALEVHDLSTALVYVGSFAQGAGVSLEETAAILAQLSNVGFDASQSGMALRQAIIRMSDPTKEAQAAMEALNISFFDSKGTMKDFTALLPEIATALEGMTDQQKLAYMNQLFGVRAGSAMLALLNQEIDASGNFTGSLADMTEKMYEQGVAQEQADNVMDSTYGKFERLKGMVDDLKITLGDAVLGTDGMSVAIESLAEILKDPALIETLQVLGETVGQILLAVMPILANVIKALLPIINQFAKFLQDLLPIIEPLVVFIGEFLVEAFEMFGPILEDFLPIILDLARIFMDAIMPALEAFKPIMGEIPGLFEELKDPLKSVVGIIEDLSPFLEMAANILATSFIIQINALKAAFILLEPFLAFFEDVFDSLSPFIEDVNTAVEDLTKFIQGLMTPLEDVVNLLGDFIGLMLDASEGEEEMADAAQRLRDNLHPGDPCLAEAFDLATTSGYQFKTMLDELSSTASTRAAPQIESLNRAVSPIGEIIAEERVGTDPFATGGNTSNTVNITIGHLDEETMDELEESLTGLFVV